MRSLLARFWHSPSFMTYGSFLSRSSSTLIVLPFVLAQLDTAEINLWYLFATITSLHIIVDIGFAPTFSRVISYTLGGSGVSNLHKPDGSATGKPNWGAMSRVFNCMQYMYSRFGLFWFLVLTILGTLAVIKPSTLVENTLEAWICWLLVVISSTFGMVGIKYTSLLQGANEIAIFRRWETITAGLSTLSAVIILQVDGTLLSLVIVQQFWLAFGFYRNKWLAKSIVLTKLDVARRAHRDNEVMASIWPSAWRTGVGVLSGYGLIQISAIVYAQVSTPEDAAKYFLALRLIQLVSQFSQAPFYSRLPRLASLYAQGVTNKVISTAREGMRYSILAYALGFLGLGIAGPILLEQIGSNVPFPDRSIWTILGLAFLAERFGAMHLNLYSVANRIVNHIANGSAGLIYLLCAAILFPWSKMYAFPIALLIGNVFVYASYCAHHSYKEFRLSFWSFDALRVLSCLAVIIIYFIIVGQDSDNLRNVADLTYLQK